MKKQLKHNDDTFVTQEHFDSSMAAISRTLQQMPTKKDLERFATKEDLKSFATKEDVTTILKHFDVAVENITDEFRGAFKDKISLVDDKHKKLTQRVERLEQHAGLSVAE